METDNQIIEALYRQIMNAICCEAVQHYLTCTAHVSEPAKPTKPANARIVASVSVEFRWRPSAEFKARYLALIDTLDEYLDKAGQPYVDAVMQGDSCRADEFARPAFDAVREFGKEINAA